MNEEEFRNGIINDDFSMIMLQDHCLDQIKTGDYIAHETIIGRIKQGCGDSLGNVYKVEVVEKSENEFQRFLIFNCFSVYNNKTYNNLRGLSSFYIIRFEDKCIDIYPDE